MSGNDKAIIEAVRAGENWAVQLIYDRIQPLIKNRLYVFQDWEDVKQQCVLEIVESVERISEVRNFWGLVREIAITTIIDFNRRHTSLRSRYVSWEDPIENPGEQLNVGNSRSTHETVYENRDLFLYIYQRLGEKCRRIVDLVFIKGLPYKEVAARARITEGNLRVQIHRCKERALEIAREQ